MGELLVPPQDIWAEAGDYNRSLYQFVDSTSFPARLLLEPDHLMIKSASIKDFSEKARAIKDWCQFMAITEVDWRFLLAGHLVVPLTLGRESKVGWLEIMESKTSDGTAGHFGAEYAQFYYPDFGHAAKLIKDKRIPFKVRRDSRQRWLDIQMNEQGQGLRVGNTRIVDVLRDQISSGEAKII